MKKELKNENFPFGALELLAFITESIKLREYAKYLFTKNIDTVFTLLCNFFKEDFSKEELQFVNLHEILDSGFELGEYNLVEQVRATIKTNKLKHTLSRTIKLPDLIFSQEDLEFFYYTHKRPNFIGTTAISAKVLHLRTEDGAELDGKIVCIENADPGFDWIFNHDIKALVTKYGGVASHMAIRCAELDISSAIGCGEALFEKICNADTVLIDPTNQKIETIT